MKTTAENLSSRIIFLLCLVVLSVLCLFVAVRTMRWPLVGDESLTHYVVFLLDSGWRPYAQIKDMNLPGAYLADWLVMHLLGPGALAERLFDYGLSALSAWAAWWVAHRRYRAAGLFAAGMFFLLHARDGIVQTGQRDWTATVLVLLAMGAWLHAMRSGPARWWVIAGVLAGCAAMVKPPAFAMAVPLVAGPLWRWHTGSRSRTVVKPALLVCVGMALPIATCVLWLLRQHALRALFSSNGAMVEYNASIQRAPALVLLAHGISGIRVPLLLGLLLLPFVWRSVRSIEFALLCAEAVMGFASYAVQDKGYAYQRYPFAFFALEVLGLAFLAALRSEKMWTRWAGCGALCICCLGLAPRAAVRALRYRPAQDQFGTMLKADLGQLGEPALGGKIQCLDTFSGCIRILYELRLPPRTGVIYDEFLFGRTGNTAVADNRAAFAEELKNNPPKVFIVTPQNYAGAVDSYGKIDAWPWLAAYLSTGYRLCTEHTPDIPQLWEGSPRVPLGYRVYVRRDFENDLCPAL